MAHVVDLGTQLFKANCLGGQCLVSRATATLICGDNTNTTGPTCRKLDFQNAWVTSKQELSVDLYIEVYPDAVMSVPNFVKETVETVQASLIGDNPYLRVSRIHHEHRSLATSVALCVSLVLSKVPDLSPQVPPRRLPRRVKECESEPHPPPEIDRASLPHIAIHMKSLRHCTPWTLLQTKLWLRHPRNMSFMDNNHERDISLSQQSKVVTLSSPHSKCALLAPLETIDTVRSHTQSLVAGDKIVWRPGNLLKDDEIRSVKQHIYLNKMIGCSIQCLVNGYSQQYKSSVNKSTIEEGPSLSNLTPLLFKPGHYENIRQRAGLIPMVTRSMARLFRTSHSFGSKQKIVSVKSKLRVRYGNCTDTESTDVGYLPRSLIRCVVWTALQRATYKVEWPKKSLSEGSGTMLFSDDWLLTEESDQYDESDEQMLYSGASSVTGSDDILSNRSDDIEPDSGYSSLSSPEKLFPRFSDRNNHDHDLDDEFFSGTSTIDDCESDIISRPDTEGKGSIIGSSSSPPTASDMFTDSDVMTHPLSSSEVFYHDDVRGDQHHEDMMDDSSSVSILSSLTNQYALSDLKQGTESKLKNDEIGDISTTT